MAGIYYFFILKKISSWKKKEIMKRKVVFGYKFSLDLWKMQYLQKNLDFNV